jgi:diguanylate cyclase (GGDEF)-like protein/PAS domain S-box-containing protein
MQAEADITPSGPIHQVNRSGSARVSAFPVAAAAVAAFAIVNVLWLELRWGGAFATQSLTDISGAVCATLVALMAYLAWRGESHARRRPWGLLALGGAAWASGEIVWTFYELVLRREVPFPSFADIGFLAGYPLAALAIIVLPASNEQLSSRIRTLLDALVVGASVLYLGWVTVLGSLYRGESGPVIEKTIGLAYPVFDLVIAAIVLFMIARTQVGRRTTLVLLGSGLVTLAVADTAFAYLTLINKYSSGIPTDAAWNTGYLLIALGALRHDPSAPRPQRTDDRRFGLLLPYAFALVVVAAAGIRRATNGQLDAILFWGMLLIVCVVLVRQFLTLLDNMSLTRNLEAKVRDRTAALARSEERHRSLVQNSSDVVAIVDERGIIVYCSPASDRILGYAPDSLEERPLMDFVHPDDREAVDAYLTRFMAKGGVAPVMEWRVRHADGSWLPCESIGTNLLDDPGVRGFVLNIRDITERKGLELQLRYQAFHDQLTGAANRALFWDRAEHALKRAARNRKPVAVLYCDLDNLKQTNDTYGHDVGDKLLAAVCSRFTVCIRAEDTIARLGGDEFAILLPDSGGEAAAKHIASRMLQSLDDPFEIDGYEIRTSASIGIALSWGHQETDELLRNADLAMYAAKNLGKSRFELFEVAATAAPKTIG